MVRPPRNRRKKPNMTEEQRKQLCTFFALNVVEGSNPPKLKRGAQVEAAKKFDISERQAGRIWKMARQNYEKHQKLSATPQKKTKSGRKRKYDADIMREEILNMRDQDKKTLRRIAAKLGIVVSTLWRYKTRALDEDDPIIRPHTNAVKPLLTPEHEVARVLYARTKLDVDDGCYSDFFSDVHVDEKWFFLTEEQLHMWLTPDEVGPNRKTAHKSHILKVMFLCAVARPRFDEEGNCTFDGKLGIWPFVEERTAQRGSANRPAGTVELKPVNVNRKRYRQFLVEKVYPAIKEKFPGHNKSILVQQDGAKSHVSDDDPDCVAAGTTGRWNIELATQSARSPDTNICDLSFFRALQTELRTP